MDKSEITIVICCAGMGTRLGIGVTKALVNVCDKTIIVRLLEMLDDYDDIRVVVGYQAEQVIREVNKYRKDVMFAFNYNYENTGVAASLCKGMRGARKYTVCVDGDILINKKDFDRFMKSEEECLAISDVSSDEPVYVDMKNDMAIAFNVNGQYNWTGLAKIQSVRVKQLDTHVYDMLTPLLPLKTIQVRARLIDTQEDYERAVDWVKEKGCE